MDPQGTFVVNDRFTVETTRPKPDLDQNCTYDVLPGSIWGEQVDNVTTIRFARKLDTGDVHCDHPITQGTYNVSSDLQYRCIMKNYYSLWKFQFVIS